MSENEHELHNIWVLESPSTTLNKKFCANLVKEKGGPPHHHLRGFGWRDFARSANISTGDFLLFRCSKKSCDFGSDACSLFEVELYGGSGLAKRLRSPASTSTPPASARPKEYVSEKPAERLPKRFKGEDTCVKEEKSSDDEEYGAKHSYSTDDTSEPEEEEEAPPPPVEFPLTLAKSRWSYVYFPANFAKKAKLKGKKNIFLVNPNSGKKWKVELRWYKRAGIRIVGGWSRFRYENKLKKDAWYIQVHVSPR